MTINRWAARSDSNRHAIVDALRAAGAVVYDLRRPVDLLVAFRGQTILVEIKRPAGPRGGTAGRKHTKAQSEFLATWVGGPVATVESPEAALRAIGVLK
jgi:hypothetical protein